MNNLLLTFHSVPYISAFIAALSAYNYHAHLQLYTDQPLQVFVSVSSDLLPTIKRMAAQQGATKIEDMLNA